MGQTPRIVRFGRTVPRRRHCIRRETTMTASIASTASTATTANALSARASNPFRERHRGLPSRCQAVTLGFGHAVLLRSANRTIRRQRRLPPVQSVPLRFDPPKARSYSSRNRTGRTLADGEVVRSGEGRQLSLPRCVDYMDLTRLGCWSSPTARPQCRLIQSTG